jgi:hypothetical protein
LLIGILFAFTVATFIGLGATWYASIHGVDWGGVTIGAWTARPRTGTTDIDPYSRALIARNGALPLASGDGVAFTARTDSAGRPLSGRCDVTIAGVTPAARYWTLTLSDPRGHPIANQVGRYGFTSEEIVRRSDGSFTIVATPHARPGNWLPTAGADSYILVLRLYDTSVGVATRASRETPMPAITTGACP